MNYSIIGLSIVAIISNIIQGDYWHAATWLIVALVAAQLILEDRTIRDLKRALHSARASRDAWKIHAYANTTQERQ